MKSCRDTWRFFFQFSNILHKLKKHISRHKPCFQWNNSVKYCCRLVVFALFCLERRSFLKYFSFGFFVQWNAIFFLVSLIHSSWGRVRKFFQGNAPFPFWYLHHWPLIPRIKGACSINVGKWIVLKLADTVTFPTNVSSKVKNLQICISFASNWDWENTVLLFFK